MLPSQQVKENKLQIIDFVKSYVPLFIFSCFNLLHNLLPCPLFLNPFFEKDPYSYEYLLSKIGVVIDQIETLKILR